MSLVPDLVNNNQIVITHVATGFQVSFAAFLDTFSDAFQSNWNEESVFGRMDSIATFRNTERALALAWAVPANSFEEAQENLGKINQMISFLYPLYDQGAGGATLINQSPLVRIKFGNLVQNVNGDGLLGWLHGITFDPMMDNGVFTETSDGEKYYPKSYRLNCELTVLHENKFGYSIEEYSSPQKYKGENFNVTTVKFENSDKRVSYNTFPYGSTSPGDQRTFKTEFFTEKVIDQQVARTGLPNNPSAAIPAGAINVRQTANLKTGNLTTTYTKPQFRPKRPDWAKGAKRRKF